MAGGKVSFDFSGSCYAVTGASSGIGREVAVELAESGAMVLAIARRRDRLDELADLYTGRIVPAAADVCNAEAMTLAVKEFVREHGKLQGSVHAAGTSGITPLRGYDVEAAQTMLQVSFWAGMDFLQLVSRKKYSEEEAAHVLFSSVSAVSSAKGMFAYNAAKAAVLSAVKTIAKELAPRQRVNAVLPGWVGSAMTKELSAASDMDEAMSRELLGEGTPEDAAGMVLYLLSERARWITGTAAVVDGGFLA